MNLRANVRSRRTLNAMIETPLIQICQCFPKLKSTFSGKYKHVVHSCFDFAANTKYMSTRMYMTFFSAAFASCVAIGRPRERERERERVACSVSQSVSRCLRCDR